MLGLKTGSKEVEFKNFFAAIRPCLATKEHGQHSRLHDSTLGVLRTSYVPLGALEFGCLAASFSLVRALVGSEEVPSEMP